MSNLVFDGVIHTLTLYDQQGRTVGCWPANNIVERGGNHLPFVPNGDHAVQTTIAPRKHLGTDQHGRIHDSVDGKYGSHGAVVMNPILGHTGIAVHSGRAHVKDKVGRIGINHATEGCIRTTDEAMSAIAQTMRSDPLTIVRVLHNHDQHY